MDRALAQRAGFVLLALVALVVVVPILLVIGTIAVQGMAAINWEFLTAMPREGMKAGGIFPAIVGTLILVAGTAVAAIPVGVGWAIYLAAEVVNCDEVLVYPSGLVERAAAGRAEDRDHQPGGRPATPMILVRCRFTERLAPGDDRGTAARGDYRW